MSDDFADKFWDLGNYVVGFAAAQGVAFAISIGTSSQIRNRVRPAWRLVLGAIVVATALYMTGIVVCAGVEVSLRGGTTSAVWVAAGLRCGAVAAVNILAATAIWLNRRP